MQAVCKRCGSFKDIVRGLCNKCAVYLIKRPKPQKWYPNYWNIEVRRRYAVGCWVWFVLIWFFVYKHSKHFGYLNLGLLQCAIIISIVLLFVYKVIRKMYPEGEWR